MGPTTFSPPWGSAFEGDGVRDPRAPTPQSAGHVPALGRIFGPFCAYCPTDMRLFNKPQCLLLTLACPCNSGGEERMAGRG